MKAAAVMGSAARGRAERDGRRQRAGSRAGGCAPLTPPTRAALLLRCRVLLPGQPSGAQCRAGAAHVACRGH